MLWRDPERANVWVVHRGEVEQSYVDLDDPTHLEFEYMRFLGHIADRMRPGPLRAVHVGGAACTFPRYLAVTRPGSQQTVFEIDASLAGQVQAQLGPAAPGVEVRIGEGRRGIEQLASGGTDLAVVDVFDGSELPQALSSVEFARELARVLREDGVYLVNIADGDDLLEARELAATLQAVFEYTFMLAEPRILGQGGFGNLVIAASRSPFPDTLPSAPDMPCRLVGHDELTRFTTGHAPVHDG